MDPFYNILLKAPSFDAFAEDQLKLTTELLERLLKSIANNRTPLDDDMLEELQSHFGSRLQLRMLPDRMYEGTPQKVVALTLDSQALLVDQRAPVGEATLNHFAWLNVTAISELLDVLVAICLRTVYTRLAQLQERRPMQALLEEYCQLLPGSGKLIHVDGPHYNKDTFERVFETYPAMLLTLNGPVRLKRFLAWDFDVDGKPNPGALFLTDDGREWAGDSRNVVFTLSDDFDNDVLCFHSTRLVQPSFWSLKKLTPAGLVTFEQHIQGQWQPRQGGYLSFYLNDVAATAFSDLGTQQHLGILSEESPELRPYLEHLSVRKSNLPLTA